MLDFNNIPKSSKYSQEIYTVRHDTAATSATGYTWIKPRGVTFIHILCVGGGGGGGAGFQGAASAAGGGGGGCGGATSFILTPAYWIPDKLHIRLGIGGQGGQTIAGTAGTSTRVKFNPYGLNDSSAAADIMDVISHATLGGLGGIGTASAGGASAASTNGTLGSGYSWTNMVGISANTSSGTSGGFSVKGIDYDWMTTNQNAANRTSIALGGTGGGGLPAINTTGTNGGSFISTGVDFVLGLPLGGVGTSASTAGGNGTDGIRLYPYNFYTGGTGGASGGGGTTATPTVGGGGGNGGNGFMGSGGGGAGACLTGATPRGRGGNGGDGFCIITAW